MNGISLKIELFKDEQKMKLMHTQIHIVHPNSKGGGGNSVLTGWQEKIYVYKIV